MRVLYLEDNALDADLTRRALGKLAPEMDLTTVPTLAEGMKLLQQVGKPFDIILCDFHLTDGNALELLRALPGLHVSLPFVVVTGHGDEEQAVTALKAGADDYVVKQKDYLDHLADILKRAQDTHRTYRHRHELPLHVLYLEHHPTDVELTEQHINRYAPYIHLHVESNAAAGLSLLPEYGGVSAFDVVVTDLNMPGMSGLDILKEIKQVRNLEIPVVIVTGQGDEELAIQTLKLGADDYLVKTGNYLFNLPSLLENAFFRVQLQREKEALRASEERFRLLAENAQDMVYRLRLSPELRYEYVSPSAERMTGYKPEAFYTNPRLGFEMAYPEDKHLLEPLIHPKAKFERTISLRWIRKDGQIIWVEQKNTPIYDENKTLVAIEGIVRDITERRLAAAAVQESELRFRSLFDHATDAILIMEDCAFIDCNKMAEELYGWSKAEIYGRMPWEFSPEKQADGRDSQTEAKERIAAALKGKTQFFEWKHIHRDGSVFDAEVHLNRLVLPDKTLLVAQVRDITAKKEMGEALLESETKLRAIVEQVPAVVYTETFDPERRVIFISPQVETLFGYTPEEWMAVPGFWVSIVHADDLKRVLENDAKVVKTGEHSLDEYRIRCRDGAYCWVSDEARLIRDKNGKLLLWQGVLTDITERKQAEERLRESEERFATMFRTSPAAIAMTRMRDNILIDVNGAWERITGYPRTEAIGNAASRLNLWVEPAQRDQMIEMMRKQGSASGEVKIRQKSGEYCETLMSGEIIELAGEKYLLTMAQDITERKEADNLLIESEMRYRSMFENNHASMLIIDPENGAIYDANSAACAYYGWTKEELLKKRIDEINTLTTSEIKKEMDLALNEKRSYFLFKHRLADGSIRDVEVYSGPVKIKGRNLLYSIIHDITERRKAEEALQRSKQETEHANHLLLALSQAAQALQNVRTQKEVYEALQEHMDALGYSTSIFELADTGRALKLTYAKYNPSLIRKAEKLVGLRMSDFTFRPQPGGIYDRVLMQGETVHTEDSEQVVKEVIPKKLHALAQPITDLLHMKLTTSAPLIVGEKVIGVLTINGAKLSEADNPAIMAFARQAAIAIQNAQLFEQKQQEINERKRAEEALEHSKQKILHTNSLLLALNDASQAVQRVHTKIEVYQIIAEQMAELGYEATVFEFNPESTDLRFAYLKYPSTLIRKAEKLTGLSFHDYHFHPQQGGLLQKVIDHGEIIYMDDPELAVAEILPKQLRSLARVIADSYHVQPTLFAPLLVSDKIIGIVSIAGAGLAESDSPAIMAFARQAAIAIQNAQLFEQKQQEINERKRAEEKLRESEELISKFIENSPIYAYVKEVTPTESRVIKASENFTEMVGIPGSKMIGKTMEELFPAEFATKITADDWQVASGGRILKLDEDLNGRNYTTFKFPIVQGEKTLLAGYTVDITERKQAEMAIRESEEKFRFLAENMIDIIWIIDLNFRNIYVSPSVEKLLGYTVEERMGMSPEEMLTPDSLSHARERLAKELKAIARGDRRINETLTMELEYYHKNGSTLWMESAVRLMLDATGEPTGIYGVSRDITERRKAEMALRESEEKFRLLLESSGVGAGYYTLNGTVLLFNREAAKQMGGKPEDFAGKSVSELFPQAKEEYLKRIKAAAQSATPMDYEDCVDLPTGRKWFLSNYSKVVDSHGTIIGVQILSHDITEQKEAEEAVKLLNTTLEQRVAERTRELQDAQEKLVRQEKLAVLGQLAGGVGHELRNPLGVIKNAIYYLRMVQPDADEKIKEYLGIIDSETRVADKIITDLLDFSRIKSVDREAVTIGELVEGALQRFPPNEHIKVIKKIPEPDQKIYADPRQMVQVLGNLTVNACQAMPEGGTLTISAVVKGNEATIAVKDNGTGILPENLNKLFEPLFTTKAKGIGLGLAVSKKLMEANSGRISVKSEAGKGSTFTLHLPVAH